MILAIGLWTFLHTLVTGSATVTLENLALRHLLLVLQRSVRRPRLARRDRVLFSEAACQEQSSLVVSAPSLSSSFGRTTAGRVPCSLGEVGHPSLFARSVANDDSPAPDRGCDRAAAPSGSRLSTSAKKRLALTVHEPRLPAEPPTSLPPRAV